MFSPCCWYVFALSVWFRLVVYGLSSAVYFRLAVVCFRLFVGMVSPSLSSRYGFAFIDRSGFASETVWTAALHCCILHPPSTPVPWRVGTAVAHRDLLTRGTLFVRRPCPRQGLHGRVQGSECASSLAFSTSCPSCSHMFVTFYHSFRPPSNVFRLLCCRVPSVLFCRATSL
jgi:hypothetical protein